MKNCLTDTRGVERWTRADRNRPCDRAIVSARWPITPFGMRDIEVMPSIQPGVLYFDGKVADANGYNGRLEKELRFNTMDPFDVGGAPLPIWVSADGRQELWAINVSDIEVVESWARVLIESFPWARGLHLDYLTSLGWLVPDRPAWMWSGWDSGYALLCMILNKKRPMWKLIGQQYHRTSLTSYIDGMYHEEAPTHFGQSFAEVAELLTPDSVVEIRVPSRNDADYHAVTKAMVEEAGCYISWGRDATAGVGL